DSPKMMVNATDRPEIYTQVGTEKLVINGLQTLESNTEIPLGFMTKTAGTAFSFKAIELSNFDADTKLVLKDNATSPATETELTANGAAYEFSSDVTNSTGRFSLLFRAPGNVTAAAQLPGKQVKVFANIQNQIVIQSVEKCNYAIYNITGQLLVSGTTTHSPMIVSRFAQGVYVVKAGDATERVIIK
ncbi:MAG: T9SS type A sorting domain-containing protein, partial [Paludibacter sp.]|nr:T9SS type A sorting domain-containing protein [Paludibacter sp.]